MITQLRAIREALADMDASDKDEVRLVVDRCCDELDDLIEAEEAADAEQVTTLVAPDDDLELVQCEGCPTLLDADKCKRDVDGCPLCDDCHAGAPKVRWDGSDWVPAEPEDRVVDLMAALEESVQAAREARDARR